MNLDDQDTADIGDIANLNNTHHLLTLHVVSGGGNDLLRVNYDEERAEAFPDGIEITLEGKEIVWDTDEGPRASTAEGLAKLRTPFKMTGKSTAGNSSQTSDGAALELIMTRAQADELGLEPLAELVTYQVTGCHPDEMGVGPRYAIPKLLDKAGLAIEDIGLWEINEAFASQALYCIRELGLEPYMDRINVNGGAIALGHPLGCTGAKLCATLLANMQAQGVRYGVESMCIGGGMGAAALFELYE